MISRGGIGAGLVRTLAEATVTFASPIGALHPLAYAMAGLVVAALVWGTVAALRGSELQRPLALVGLCALLLFLRLVLNGPAFVPGLLAASPLAAAGLGAAVHFRRSLPIALALGPLPLVWWFQYSGAALAQWGGRYILTSGAVLLAFGCASLGSTAPRLLKGFVVGNVLLALVGVSMLVARTQVFATGGQWLAERPEDALVFSDSFLAREAGSLGLDQQWLAAETAEDRDLLPTILDETGVRSFGWVTFSESEVPEIDGFVPVASEPAPYGLGLEVLVTTFEARPAG